MNEEMRPVAFRQKMQLAGSKISGLNSCLLFVHDCVVDLHALSVRSLGGLVSRLTIAGKNGSSFGRDFAIVFVDDLDCIVINFGQRGCIPICIAFDRIVLSVKLAAPLAVSGLTFCVDTIVRKSKPPVYRIDLAVVGSFRWWTRIEFRLLEVNFPVSTEHVCSKLIGHGKIQNNGCYNKHSSFHRDPPF